MTFEQLLYVEVLSHYNSLSKAAEVLHISKPGLSLAISDLENELGVKIFERTSRGSVLTQEGTQMLGVISEILRSRSSLERLAAFAAGKDRQQIIRIRYINTMFEAFILPFIRNYSGRYENVYYEISRADMKTIIAQVRSGEIDAGFVSSSDIESEWIRDLKFQPVCYGRVELMVRADSPLVNRTVTMEDLKQQKFCMYDDLYQQLLFDRLQYLCGPLELVLKTDDHWAITQAIEGLNLVCLGRSAQGHFSHEETDDSIRTVSIAHIINDKISLGWLSNPRVHISDAANALITDITNELTKE